MRPSAWFRVFRCWFGRHRLDRTRVYRSAALHDGVTMREGALVVHDLVHRLGPSMLRCVDCGRYVRKEGRDAEA